MIDFSFLKQYWPLLLEGTITTLEITALSMCIGFIFGTILGFLHSGKSKVTKMLITLFVTIFRGTPMLIQISFLYYLLPALGIELSAFATAVLAIGLNSTAYISQIIKSGITSVDKGQIEAAQVSGLSEFQTMRYIIFPQAIRVVIPALLNEFITLIKDSSLAYTIGVTELFKQSSRIISITYNAIPVFIVMGLIYLTLTTTLSIISNVIEKRMKTHA